MTGTIAIKGLAGLEHRQADGSFVAYQPGAPVPPAIRAGDRLRVRLEVRDAAWIYAVSVIRKTDYWKLGAWAPGGAAGGIRMLWPGGRVLTAEDATMTTLIVIASGDELPWLAALTRAECSMLVGKPPAEPPVSVCDHLYGLFHKIPRRIRGLVPPRVELLDDGGTRIPAIVSEHAGAPYTAIEWQFKPSP